MLVVVVVVLLLPTLPKGKIHFAQSYFLVRRTLPLISLAFAAAAAASIGVIITIQRALSTEVSPLLFEAKLNSRVAHWFHFSFSFFAKTIWKDNLDFPFFLVELLKKRQMRRSSRRHFLKGTF